MQGRLRVVFALKKYLYDQSFLVCSVLAPVLSWGFFIFFFIKYCMLL